MNNYYCACCLQPLDEHGCPQGCPRRVTEIPCEYCRPARSMLDACAIIAELTDRDERKPPQ